MTERHDPDIRQPRGSDYWRLRCSCGWKPPFNSYATRDAAAEVHERHAAAHGYAPTFPVLGRRFKVMYQEGGRWHQKYASADGVQAALDDARAIDANAYAVQTS